MEHIIIIIFKFYYYYLKKFDGEQTLQLSYFKGVTESHLNLRRDDFSNLLVKAPSVGERLASDTVCPTELASQSLSPPLRREGNAQVCCCQSD